MHVIFRYDDFSAAEQLPFGTDQALFDLFLALRVPLLVAVTPRMSADIRDPLNDRFFAIEDDVRRIRLLARGLEQGWQLALHGLTHQSTVALSGSEFRGVPPEVQEEKIAAGRHALAACFPGVPLEVFVPPWNSYDQATIQCLPRQGFRALCAGDTERARQEGGLRIIPSLMTPRDLLDYLHSFSAYDLVDTVGDGCLVITMHQYEFRLLGRNDYVDLHELARAVDMLIEADVTPEVVEVDAPAEHYMPRRQSGLMAKIHLLQQVRQQRGRGAWTLASRLGRPLGRYGDLLVKTVVAHACWQLDRTERRLRSELRPAQVWLARQHDKRSSS